jgi:hypothetical protein
MNERCRATKGKDFRVYAARGISVCERWAGPSGYENFLADMGERPSAGYSIDRMDNDRGYEPDNCRWATDPQQCRNRRNSIFVEWEGVRWQLNDLCEAKGLNDKVVRGRLKIGWSIADAMTVPVRGKVKNGDLSV